MDVRVRISLRMGHCTKLLVSCLLTLLWVIGRERRGRCMDQAGSGTSAQGGFPRVDLLLFSLALMRKLPRQPLFATVLPFMPLQGGQGGGPARGLQPRRPDRPDPDAAGGHGPVAAAAARSHRQAPQPRRPQAQVRESRAGAGRQHVRHDVEEHSSKFAHAARGMPVLVSVYLK